MTSGTLAEAGWGCEERSVASLTARQQEVLGLMAEGLSNPAIARRLWLTEKTVVQHISNIYETLEMPPSPDEHRRVVVALRFLAEARRERDRLEPRHQAAA